MTRHVAIEPCAGGFVIRVRGMEKRWIYSARAVCSLGAMYIPSDDVFHFETIDAARDFCWACGFTWSVRVP
jgi:hypothetical protein